MIEFRLTGVSIPGEDDGPVVLQGDLENLQAYSPAYLTRVLSVLHLAVLDYLLQDPPAQVMQAQVAQLLPLYVQSLTELAAEWPRIDRTTTEKF